MRKIAKPFCFILTAFILIVSFLAIFGIDSQFGDKRTVYIKGISDIRWGIDINGGLDVTFCAPDGVDATDSQMSAAESIINQRLVNLNITDSEVYVDYNKDRIVVRFPWKSDEKDFDPEKAIKEIGEMAEITFREGTATDSATGLPDAKYTDTLVIDGKSI
jgi:preprotein translocase subunit SecD